MALRRAWKGERFSFQGQCFKFDNVMVGPRPVQQPHPPMRMAANSAETFDFVGRSGLPLFVGLRDHGIRELRTHLKTYRDAWRAAGHPGDGDVCLRLPVYAAETEKAAREESHENITYFFRRHAELLRSGMGRADTGPVAELNPGGLLAVEPMHRTLRILTHEVMPAFR